MVTVLALCASHNRPLSFLHRDRIGALETDASNISGKPIGVLGHDLHGVRAVSLEDANRPSGADPGAVKEDNDLPDDLLLGLNLRRYGKPTEEPRCAPLLHIGGRCELKSRLRSAVSPWIDPRNRADVVRDELEERGLLDSRQFETVRSAPSRPAARITSLKLSPGPRSKRSRSTTAGSGHMSLSPFSSILFSNATFAER
jgi:hypothetical protein